MKEKVQTRIDETLLEKATIVGKMLGIESEADILRYALTELVKNNLDNIKKYSDMYKPNALTENEWHKSEWGKYIKWNMNQKAEIESTIFEVFTDNTINVQVAKIPSELSELVEKINDSSYEIKVNKEGFVLLDNAILDKYDSQIEILQVYSCEYGNQTNFKECETEEEIQSIANDYGIWDRIF